MNEFVKQIIQGQNLASDRWASKNPSEVNNLLNEIVDPSILPKHAYGDDLTMLEVMMLQGAWDEIENAFRAMLEPRSFDPSIKFPRESVRKDTIIPLGCYLDNVKGVRGLFYMFSAEDVVKIHAKASDLGYETSLLDEIWENLTQDAIDGRKLPNNFAIESLILEVYSSIDVFIEWIDFVKRNRLFNDVKDQVNSIALAFAQAAVGSCDAVESISILNGSDEFPLFMRAEVLSKSNDIWVVHNNNEVVCFNPADFDPEMFTFNEGTVWTQKAVITYIPVNALVANAVNNGFAGAYCF